MGFLQSSSESAGASSQEEGTHTHMPVQVSEAQGRGVVAPVETTPARAWSAQVHPILQPPPGCFLLNNSNSTLTWDFCKAAAKVLVQAATGKAHTCRSKFQKRRAMG
jgi:hypothetical protein